MTAWTIRYYRTPTESPALVAEGSGHQMRRRFESEIIRRRTQGGVLLLCDADGRIRRSVPVSMPALGRGDT